MRRLATIVAVAFVAVAGCGGDDADEPKGSLATPLSYVPANAGAVAVIPTDLDDPQVRAFDDKLAERVLDSKLEPLLKQAIEASFGADLDYEDDVKPLLGNPLVASVPSPQGVAGDDPDVLVSWQTRDGDKLREVVERLPGIREAGKVNDATRYEFEEGAGGGSLAIDGDVLLVGDSAETVEGGLARSAGDHLTEERFEAAFEGMPEETLIRAGGNLAALFEMPELRRYRQVKWLSALRIGTAAVSIQDDDLVLDGSANTDAELLADADLPLPPGAEPAPEVVRRESEIVSGSRNQSQTTVFLLRAVRDLYPNSRFVRDVAELESELKIDFEEEVLRQFDGPSASVLSPDGSFAARSTVRDPERMRDLLEDLAPHLPRLIEDLEPLQAEGQTLLLLFAPDAPVTTGPLRGKIELAEPRSDDELYRVTGLEGGGPTEMHFGMVGDVFVIGSDAERARAMANEPAEPVEGVTGASVTRFRYDALEAFELGLGLDSDLPFGEIRGSLTSSRERLRGTLRLAIE